MFFALPALLVTIVFIGGLLIGQEGVQRQLQAHLQETVGSEGAKEMTMILKNASQPKESRVGWTVGAIMLVVGASGALRELQAAVNRAWCVEPDPNAGWFRTFFVKRFFSFLFVVAFAILLLVSVILTWFVAAFGHMLAAHVAGWLSTTVMTWVHIVVSLLIYTLLFAVLLRYLPDAHVDWKDVWIGALVTAVLFWVGQWLIARYMSYSNPTSAYGAAGSLALILIWMYYSSLIFFYGVEFTQVLVRQRGKKIVPERGAKLCPSRHGGGPKQDLTPRPAQSAASIGAHAEAIKLTVGANQQGMAAHG
jgi:membrane protein